MAEPLSPAAQAVLDAFNREARPEPHHQREAIAAALEALADQDETLFDESEELMPAVRAALDAAPAVPEGRDPAAVIRDLSDEEIDQLERQSYVETGVEEQGQREVLFDHRAFARAATLLQQQHLQPVPVSERLPGPEDCDAEGRCWWFCPPDFWKLRSHATAVSAFVTGATHWLPFNALPLPATTPAGQERADA